MTTMAVVMPALFAGLVAIGVTVAIERWGGRLGGLLGTLPTTIVPAAVGIAHQSQGVEAFQAAMYMAPVGMLIDALFLYLWRVLPAKLPPRWALGVRLAVMTGASLCVWGVAAVCVVLATGGLRDSGFALVWVGVGTTALIAIVGVLACWRPHPAPKGKRRVGPLTLVARGSLAATAIGVAVWLASVGGPLAAGIAAVFPAIFLTTMISLWVSQGESVQAGAVGPMMLGATSVAAFSVLAAWTMPAFGLAMGACVAWLGAAFGATLPAWLWLRRQEPALAS